ncbi:MAG TPA: YfhO family protein [Blastocatellia bacterium]|nr:YfhO family protein [Blastocatellia bacterium]
MKAEPEINPGDSAATSPQAGAENSPSLSPTTWQRHAINLASLVALLLVMFWRVFLLGETLIDVATLNNQLPWGYSAGPSDYPYNRRDLTDMYVTREYFVVAAYRDGEMPLWNPYTMAGHPIYADGVTRTLSPLLLFYKLFDVPLGYSLARISELMLAAIFMYIFLVALGVSARGALIGALVFELSAHALLHLTGLGWFGGLMWLPLIMLFVDRAARRQQFRPALLAGVMFAAQFFCGYLPNQIYYAGAIVLYYLIAAHLEFGKLEGRRRRRALGKTVALMATTLAVGLMLAATQWAPMLELLRYSNRKIVGAEMGYIYLPPWYGLTLIFPNLFGAAYDTRTLTLFTALGVSHDHILYIGVAALAPLGFALFWWKQSRRGDTGTRGRGEGVRIPGSPRQEHTESPTIPRVAASPRPRVTLFALLAAVSLVVMMTTPLYVPVTRYVPVLQVIRVAVRAGVIFHFAAAVLVALGADLLMQASADLFGAFARLARRFFYAAAAFVAMATIAAWVMKATGFAAESEARGWRAYLHRTAAALTPQFLPPDAGILVPLGMLAIVAGLFWLTSAGRFSRRALLAGLCSLLVIDLFWLSGQFNQSYERSRVYQATEITTMLRGLPPGRVLVVPADLESNRRVSSSEDKIIAPPNTLLPYQIPTVAGKNQQFPKWYRDYAALIEPQPNLSHVVFNEPRSRYFDLLDVRYVVTHADTPLDGYERLATAEGVAVYENKNALPRAFFVDRALAVASHADAVAALREPTFDARREVVIESDAGLSANATPPPVGMQASADAASIIEDQRNRVVIETANQTDAWLVLSDNFYPGWRAAIDGNPTEIFQANVTMRAVKVPAGRHVLSFVFAPRVFRASLVISLVAAALLGLGLAFVAVRRGK